MHPLIRELLISFINKKKREKKKKDKQAFYNSWITVNSRIGSFQCNYFQEHNNYAAGRIY